MWKIPRFDSEKLHKRKLTCIESKLILLKIIGSKVSGTIRQGILDLEKFEGQEQTLMLGYVSALVGCCIWLIVATILNLPVSGTHSIVGACVGMGIVSVDFQVVKWLQIAKIG